MIPVQFKTPYNMLHPAIPEKLDQISKTQKSGYITAQKRIETIMLAGQRLKESRQEMYDWPDGNIDEDFYDPTRRKGYDLADATQDSLINQRNLRDAKSRQDASEALKKASEAKLNEPSDKIEGSK